MTEQPSLFEPPAPHASGPLVPVERFTGTPYAAGSDTSQAAAVSIALTAGTLNARIFDYLEAAGAAGATCAELEDAFGLRHQTASARVWDLRTRGYIRDSGARRRTSSGRLATVWIAR